MVRYLTRVSGFLTIRSDESTRYLDFNSMFFELPAWNWVPPFPYCPHHVLFPARKQSMEEQTAAQAEQMTWNQLLDNDSLGG